MNAALIVSGTVANIIVLADGTDLTPELARTLGGDTLVPAASGAPCGPGWDYDPDGDPPFTAPPVVAAPQPVVDPVAVAFAAIGTIAAQDGPTLNEKLAAIVDVLAQNAPTQATT